MPGDKRSRDPQTRAFEFRPGVGGFPALGGMDRSRDPAGIALNKAHLLINVRRNEGGWISRGGQSLLFPDPLHEPNVNEVGEFLWDESSGIGNITGIDPGADDSRYGGAVLYCGSGEEISTWDGTTQRDFDVDITLGAGETALPVPMFDEANGIVWGYRTVYDLFGDPLYRIYCRMSYVNHVFGITPVFSSPPIQGISPWGGPLKGVPSRIAWSLPDRAYYVTTANGLVLSFTEDGTVSEEDDNSVDTTTDTLYGVPVIFEAWDEVVLLVGNGTGLVEPTTMNPPVSYYKDTLSGTWTADTSITFNFVPTTRPVQHRGDIYIGGYKQAADSFDDQVGMILVWLGSAVGWSIAKEFTGQSRVRGLCKFGQYLYYIYDDVVNTNNSILGRIVSSTVGNEPNHKLFHNQLPSTFTYADGLWAYRGNLYTRFYNDDPPYNGTGLLWRSPGTDTGSDWVRATAEDPPGQELNGSPFFSL